MTPRPGQRSGESSPAHERAAVDVRAYGDAAALIEAVGPAHVFALRDALASAPGVLEIVPAERTVLIRFDPRRTNIPALADATRAVPARPVRPPADEHIELAVHYDGADLDEVAELTGWRVADVIARHAAGDYTVAFCGFAPGFAYLTGLDERLHVPRRSTPRTAVPAGSVAIAGEYTGVYPHRSPGGWRLLGHTDAPLWDLARTPPALLTPGTTVRFRPT